MREGDPKVVSPASPHARTTAGAIEPHEVSGCLDPPSAKTRRVPWVPVHQGFRVLRHLPVCRRVLRDHFDTVPFELWDTVCERANTLRHRQRSGG